MINSSEIEIILPVYNEEKILEENTLKIKKFLDEHKFKSILSIVDNGSTDRTLKIAKNLEGKISNIYAFRLEERGRGRALRFRILESSCSLIGYMDIDLSANIFCFLDMYKEIQNNYDIIISSRLLLASFVRRVLNFIEKAKEKKRKDTKDVVFDVIFHIRNKDAPDLFVRFNDGSRILTDSFG